MSTSDIRPDNPPNDEQELTQVISDSVDGRTIPSRDLITVTEIHATSLFPGLEDTGNVQGKHHLIESRPSRLDIRTTSIQPIVHSDPPVSKIPVRPVPHSRRVDIVRPPSNYKLPPSLNKLSSSANSIPRSTSSHSSFSSFDIATLTGPVIPGTPPVPPPRSPLRPQPPPRFYPSSDFHVTEPKAVTLELTSELTWLDTVELPPSAEQDSPTSTLAQVMPLLRTHSFGSLSALLESLDPDAQAKHTSRRSKTLEKPLPTPPDDPLPFSFPPSDPSTTVTDDAASIGSSISLANAPPMTKRKHALLELLTSERAYASDLALIRDIHIPLALGQPAPFTVNAPITPPISSASSSRTLSTASDSSTSSSQLGPPMTREDTRTIFSNVAELAMFSDAFVDRLEEALGSVLEDGVGEDCVGALFLELIPALEPPYKMYITRHPTAITHLNSLPSTPALTAYLERTRTLASSLTHAWDLPSLLIKPVQRLLKYPLLLAAIMADTPDVHPDKENLRLARTRMEEVARSVNEGRRRWEVVKEVLSAKAGEIPKKKSVSVGVTASVNLSRMKSIRGVKLKESNEEAEQVTAMEGQLKRYAAFVMQLAKDVVDWRTTVHTFIMRLRDWAAGFGKVIGLSVEQRSEAFDAFMGVVSDELLTLTANLETDIKNTLLFDLGRLKDSMQAPFRLINAMNTLEPLHYGLANLNFSKNRPPAALLEASQSYLALRGQLNTELPDYLALLNKGITVTILDLGRLQARFWGDVRDRWGDLWDALRVEGERNAGAEETLKVWWERWAEAERQMYALNIVNPKKIYVERPPRKRSSTTSANVVATLAALDPSHVVPAAGSQSKHRNQGSLDFGNRRRSGSSAGTGLNPRRSNESLRSGSGKSSKSKTNKHGHLEEPQLDQFLYPPRPTPTYPSLPSPTQNSTTSRTKSMPIVSPVRTSTSSSHVLTGEGSLPPSPLPYIDLEDDSRGRTPARRSSLKKKIADSFRTSSSHSHHRRRSSSVKSVGAPTLVTPSCQITDAVPLMPYQSAARRTELQHARALYACRVIHPCQPPDGVSYRNLPFFTLDTADVYSVLREYGHPSTHDDLPLYVDDGEDCLLLVRNEVDDVGWALASFLVPLD